MLYGSIGLLPELTRQRIDLADHPTKTYQAGPPNQTPQWSCMCRLLPILTKIPARGAKPFGAFGLVVGSVTNPYQHTDLAVPHPRGTFTNAYHLAWIKYKYEHIL